MGLGSLGPSKTARWTGVTLLAGAVVLMVILGLTQNVQAQDSVEATTVGELFSAIQGTYEFQHPQPVDRIYVDHSNDSGNEDGVSWDTAFTDLQDGLALAEMSTGAFDSVEVWVAAGTYYPAPASDPARSATFNIQDGVRLFGGFAGTEDALDERDLEANTTTLSGDIDRNGELDNGNAYTVVTIAADAEATIDGVTITGGNANGNSDTYRRAGGVYNGGHLTLNNSSVSSNQAESDGGGIYNWSHGTVTLINSAVTDNRIGEMGHGSGGGIYSRSHGTVTLIDSEVTDNRIGEMGHGSGGGIYSGQDGTIDLIDSVVSDNRAAESGGGIFSGGSTLTLIDSEVTDNRAGEFGIGDGGGIIVHNSMLTVTNSLISGNQSGGRGGALSFYSGTATVTNSIISGNQAGEGGGIYTDFADMTLIDSEFIDNTATSRGGAIYHLRGKLTVANSTLSGNTSGTEGGGIYMAGGEASLINSTVSGNLTSDVGGGIFVRVLDGTGELTLINSTVSGNSASLAGGIRNQAATVHLFNSIVWGNENTDVAQEDPGSTTTFDHTIIGTSDIDCVEADHCASEDPRFVDWIDPSAPDWEPTSEGDYRLLPGSPAIDAGDNDLYNTGEFGDLDLDGNPRIMPLPDGTIDLGAYEAQFTDIALNLTVDPNPASLNTNVEITVSLSGTGIEDIVEGLVVTLSGLNGDQTLALDSDGTAKYEFDANTTGTFTLNATLGNVSDTETLEVWALPVLTVPENFAIPLAKAEGYEFDQLVSATDWKNQPLTVACDPASGSDLVEGPNLIECSTGDSLEQTVEDSFTITVASLPVLANMPEDILVALADRENVTWTDPTVTDWNGDTIEVTCVPASGSDFEVGSTTVTCGAEDELGQTVEDSFTITVASLPVLTVPENVPIPLADAEGYEFDHLVSGTDWKNELLDVDCLPVSGSNLATGPNLITCSIEDSLEQTAKDSFTITVASLPVLTVPENVPIPLAEAEGYEFDQLVSATDWEDQSLTVVCEPVSGSDLAEGPNLIQCSTEDSLKQTVEDSFTVTVASLPVLTVPENVPIPLAEAEGYEFDQLVSATDWKNQSLTVVCDPASGSDLAEGPNLIECSTGDSLEQTVEDSFTITVASLPELANLPEDFVVALADQENITWDGPDATDWNGDSINVECVPASGSDFEVGTTTVTCEAEDELGQSVSRSFTITVASLPVLDLPSDMLIPYVERENVTWTATATDWQDETFDVDCTPVSGSSFDIGDPTTVNCMFTDHADQTVSGSFTVTVASLPVLNLPEDISVKYNQRNNVTWDATATDWDENSLPVECSPESGSRFAVGDTLVSCSATDNLGQKTIEEFIVTVQEQPDPEPRAPRLRNVPDHITLDAETPDGATLEYDLPRGIDENNNPLDVVCEPEPGSFVPIGHTTVECSATDGDLTTTASFGVTVRRFVEPDEPGDPEEPGEPGEPDDPELPDFSPLDNIDNLWFWQTWARTDLPVRDRHTVRTWMWGPGPFTESLWEAYAESPNGEREVIYFDKARMEITHPDGDADDLWYVTNGLLVVELITGNRQFGDDTFASYGPAQVNVAGDPDDPNSPTYASLQNVLDAPAQEVGTLLTEQIDRGGTVSHDDRWGNYGVTVGFVDEVTQHGIAEPFWAFMRSEGLVYEDGSLNEDALFENPFYATGRPITEAYWANVNVGGEPRDVLIQCFERRCLTYTPGNDAGFVVEAGNVGQHYYSWRYVQAVE